SPTLLGRLATTTAEIPVMPGSGPVSQATSRSSVVRDNATVRFTANLHARDAATDTSAGAGCTRCLCARAQTIAGAIETTLTFSRGFLDDRSSYVTGRPAPGALGGVGAGGFLVLREPIERRVN